jgi:hypothetical protein
VTPPGSIGPTDAEVLFMDGFQFFLGTIIKFEFFISKQIGPKIKESKKSRTV